MVTLAPEGYRYFGRYSEESRENDIRLDLDLVSRTVKRTTNDVFAGKKEKG